jgi:hypothetical protein
MSRKRVGLANHALTWLGVCCLALSPLLVPESAFADEGSECVAACLENPEFVDCMLNCCWDKCTANYEYETEPYYTCINNCNAAGCPGDECETGTNCLTEGAPCSGANTNCNDRAGCIPCRCRVQGQMCRCRNP